MYKWINNVYISYRVDRAHCVYLQYVNSGHLYSATDFQLFLIHVNFDEFYLN